MACQEEIVLVIILLATGHENWHLELRWEVKQNFCHLLQSQVQDRSKSELDLALCFCVKRQWLHPVLEPEAGDWLVLCAGKRWPCSCWWHWGQSKLWSVTGLFHSQCWWVLMPAKPEAQPENRNPESRQVILSYYRSLFLDFSFSVFVVLDFWCVEMFTAAVLPVCLQHSIST